MDSKDEFGGILNSIRIEQRAINSIMSEAVVNSDIRIKFNLWFYGSVKAWLVRRFLRSAYLDAYFAGYKQCLEDKE